MRFYKRIILAVFFSLAPNYKCSLTCNNFVLLAMSSPNFPRKRVGNYELGETLGEGTFGKVRKAFHVDTGQAFAIKCLDKRQIEKQNMGTQLKREIAVMRMIRSPNIVQFYECLASKSNIYLVLELVTGGELFEMLVKERGGFSESKTRFFFRQLVEGVQCCHKKGICHRDLKPENLLLDGNGHLKISDFGLSALQDNLNEGMTLTSSEYLHTTCGSPSYVSPEVIDNAGSGYNGRKADIWSIGVILYVMATGCLPFEEKSIQELFDKIRSASYRSPRGVSAPLADLISKIFVVDPKKRISLDEIQQHTWYVGGEETMVK